MIKDTKKAFWSNGWIVGIGTTVLSVLILRGIDWFTGTQILSSVWRFIRSCFISIGRFFGQSFSLPLWGIILISFTGLGIVLLITWISLLFIKESVNISPPFLKYTSDTFDGIVYKWRYYKDYGDKYDITEFTAYCPKDNCIILRSVCPICKHGYSELKDDAELQVLVRHKIENNLYKS